MYSVDELETLGELAKYQPKNKASNYIWNTVRQERIHSQNGVRPRAPLIPNAEPFIQKLNS